MKSDDPPREAVSETPNLARLTPIATVYGVASP